MKKLFTVHQISKTIKVTCDSKLIILLPMILNTEYVRILNVFEIEVRIENFKISVKLKM